MNIRIKTTFWEEITPAKAYKLEMGFYIVQTISTLVGIILWKNPQLLMPWAFCTLFHILLTISYNAHNKKMETSHGNRT